MVVRCGMSNELISKELLLKEVDEVIAQYNWAEDGVIMDILMCIRDMVFDQPTAYDTDNKVRQLEAWKEKQLAIADREIAESDSELRKGIIKELKAITDACIENSIEIVKGGQNERSVESC